MDKYVQHPGKVFKTNNQYYFQIVLDKSSVWKAIQFSMKTRRYSHLKLSLRTLKKILRLYIY
ncbi:hypothetical protein JHX96_02575 [Staphylococcus saccharolyticus]|nr:hypothetical protein [Staphylococcus saccharolyticus]MBL7584096.1 hypothetical protein [Staphylococcus saccharolyticus]MBL7638585.1 hypothetical protein [Staphylococcus saccharolyticus]QRJ69242.1 hypothetical protein DMB75_007905 [Staphylococcus saccharolyticus]TAA93503.1 hypothetical protein DMB74_02595 [Staphylococcus saccharolyticus]